MIKKIIFIMLLFSASFMAQENRTIRSIEFLDSLAKIRQGLGSIGALNFINNSHWSGADLSIANGGTGSSTYEDDEVLYYDLGLGRFSSAGFLPGQVVLNIGSYANPTWITSLANSKITGLGALALRNSVNDSSWSGLALSVPNGGTGNANYTDDQIIFFNGANFAGTGYDYLSVIRSDIFYQNPSWLKVNDSTWSGSQLGIGNGGTNNNVGFTDEEITFFDGNKLASTGIYYLNVALNDELEDAQGTITTLQTRNTVLTDSIQILADLLNLLITASLPPKLTGLTVIAGNAELDLHWTEATGYDSVIVYRAAEGEGTFTRIGAVASGGVETFKDSSGSSADSPYNYYVKTKNNTTGFESLASAIVGGEYTSTASWYADFEEANVSDLWQAADPYQNLGSSLNSGATLLTASTTAKRTGDYGLLMTYPASGRDTAFAMFTNDIAGTRYDIEFYFYVPTGTNPNPDISGSSSTNLFVVRGGAAINKLVLSLQTNGTQYNKLLLTFNDGTGDSTSLGTTTAPVPWTFRYDEWVKVKLEYKFADSTSASLNDIGFAKLSVNDTLIITNYRNTLGGTGGAIISFNWGIVGNGSSAQGFTAGEFVYFDDLKVDNLTGTAPIRTYYVSKSGGNDAADGFTEATAWETISHVNSLTYGGNTRILFKRGDEWRERLNVLSDGTSGLRITISDYGTGALPKINGSTLQSSGWVVHSGNIWKVTVAEPGNVYFNDLRGLRVTNLTDVDATNRWYWTSNTLYVYSPIGDPSVVYVTPGVELTLLARPNGVEIAGDYVTVENLHIEKTHFDGIRVLATADSAIVSGCTIYQTSTKFDLSLDYSGISTYGLGAKIQGNTIGKQTGNDDADMNWSGMQGVFVGGTGTHVSGNIISNSAFGHTDTAYTKFEYGIRVGRPGLVVPGVTRIYDNTIYRVGGSGIIFECYTNDGDTLLAYDNTISHVGQAGIAAFKTRSEDGVGGVGRIYSNTVTYSNRIGWNNTVPAESVNWWGGSTLTGTAASGIHFNDGVQSGTDALKPYMKWYCYDNSVSLTRELTNRNSNDSDGIAIDFNANRVEVFRNTVYSNDGKGLYIYNADSCRVYYNVFHSNAAGITISTITGETAIGNQILNNTLYRNSYNNTGVNTSAIKAEIFFGLRDTYTVIKNNLMFRPTETNRYCLKYQPPTVDYAGTFYLDNNLVYAAGTSTVNIYEGGSKTLATWKTTTKGAAQNWDVNSVNADPLLVNPTSDLSISAGSPSINFGASVGLTSDYLQNPFVGAPDIGAYEKQ